MDNAEALRRYLIIAGAAVGALIIAFIAGAVIF